jgi:hypothetical protein
MVHLDVKKVGRIPDGGGWRIHGRDSDQAEVADRAKSAGAKRGYVYLHSAVDGFSRLAYTEPLPDEKGATARRSWHERRFGSLPTASTTSTGSSPTTAPATDQATSHGSSARRPGTRRPSPTHRDTTGRWSAISASWPRSSSTPESSRGRTPAHPRSRSGTFTTTITAHTAEPAVGRQPHGSGPPSPTSSPPTASGKGHDRLVVFSSAHIGHGHTSGRHKRILHTSNMHSLPSTGSARTVTPGSRCGGW